MDEPRSTVHAYVAWQNLVDHGNIGGSATHGYGVPVRETKRPEGSPG